jgi:hypothetical protein
MVVFSSSFIKNLNKKYIMPTPIYHSINICNLYTYVNFEECDKYEIYLCNMNITYGKH